MSIHVRKNRYYFLPSERFRQKCRTDAEIVYADKTRRRIAGALLLVFWGGNMIYFACLLAFHLGKGWPSQDLIQWVPLVVYLLVLLFLAITAPKILRTVRLGWIRIEIVMDRLGRSVTCRYHHFLRASTSVRFASEDVAEVVVNRMEWPGTPIKCWWVWLYTKDGSRKPIDGGENKEPIQKLAADLADVLQVTMKVTGA